MRRNNKNTYDSSQMVSNGYFKDDVRESVDEESRFLNLGASDMPKDITALEYQNERSLYSKDRASLEKYGDIMIHGSPPHSRNLSKDAAADDAVVADALRPRPRRPAGARAPPASA